MSLLELQEELSWKVRREYNMWFNHIRSELDRKRNILDKVLDPELPEWQVRIPLLWKNIQLENALFLTDDISVQFLTNTWALWNEIMRNANMMAKYDDIDMDLYEMREDIVNYNAVYWLAATIIDWRDDEEIQPISDTINPLNLIIDPKNYKGSKLRFIWVRRRMDYEALKTNKAFDKEQVMEIEWSIDEEVTKTERSQDEANNYTYSNDNEWLVDIYDHFTIHKWMKVLTTWSADLNTLIRYMEIEPLTEAERLKPTKVKFPIQLHRRKPKIGNVCWVSIADEVLVFQDLSTQLTNLQIINARIAALWPDIFIDDKLGIDTTILEKSKPGWRILPISNKSWMPTQNGIFPFTPPVPNQYTDQLIARLENLAEETTSISKQNFGLTQWGSQTKAEIQTLQQNANNILWWISNNYLRWQKEYRTAHYRSYALNMSKKGKKNISMWQKGSAVSLELAKKEFIADWKVQVVVVSRNQEQIENDKEFNKLSIIANIYLPNITSEYAKNELLRTLWDKSNIRDFDSSKYIRESVDELDAKANLELLNNDIEVPSPEANQNPDIYLDIYKQAMDTDAKDKALSEYKEFAIWKSTWVNPNEQWEWNAQALNMSMNNENQQAQEPIAASPWL